MLRPRSGIVVEVTNTRVNVEGRIYEAQHVLIIGSDSASLVVEPERIVLRAVFSDFPSIDVVGSELVKIYREGSRYQVDMFGDSISDVRVEGDNIIIKGDIVTIKFDGDGEIVNVSLPRIGKVSTRRLEISSKTPTSINVFILPFLIGAVNIYGLADVRVRRDIEKTTIKAERENV